MSWYLVSLESQLERSAGIWMHFAVSTRVLRPTSLLLVATMENKALELGLVTCTKIIMILQVI
jgi:hypothetical protein